MVHPISTRQYCRNRVLSIYTVSFYSLALQGGAGGWVHTGHSFLVMKDGLWNDAHNWNYVAVCQHTTGAMRYDKIQLSSSGVNEWSGDVACASCTNTLGWTAGSNGIYLVTVADLIQNPNTNYRYYRQMLLSTWSGWCHWCFCAGIYREYCGLWWSTVCWKMEVFTDLRGVHDV